ncbi:hypothetical protein L484_015484 [Morus notabilis]|uniref:Uncharacterized protein n=1 Tax=Morus notabilis TaxID=981085 RepID=W9S5R8_9ROSA|nr:hypothetical protein L484_015484 [Morus notabilis]
MFFAFSYNIVRVEKDVEPNPWRRSFGKARKKVEKISVAPQPRSVGAAAPRGCYNTKQASANTGCAHLG